MNKVDLVGKMARSAGISKAAAERALALAPSSAEAHTMAAAVFMLWDWDYVTAEKEFLRAIELNPGYPRAHHWYALFLTTHNDFNVRAHFFRYLRRFYG